MTTDFTTEGWPYELTVIYNIVATTKPPKDLRYGQWVYNKVMDVRPRLALILADNDQDRTLYDPFDRDYLVPAFFQWVAAHWDDEEETS